MDKRIGFKETKNNREGVVIHVYSKTLTNMLKEFAKQDGINITRFCTKILENYVKEHFEELDKNIILEKIFKEN